MSDAALAPYPAAATVEACQAACAADANCQYYGFLSWEAKCLLRNRVPRSVVNASDATRSYALFQVGAGPPPRPCVPRG